MNHACNLTPPRHIIGQEGTMTTSVKLTVVLEV